MPTWSNTIQGPPRIGGTGLQSIFKRPASSFFLLVLPFSYVPRLVDGDTQPWPLLAALILFLMNRSAKTFTRLDLLLIGSVLGALLVFFARAGFGIETLRFGYKMFAFTMLWVCVPTLPVGLVVRGMKSVILIWFMFGLLQTLALQLGMSIEIGGRFVEGRSGVPSLTPEPSLFGTLSLLALYYMLISKHKISPAYHAMAFANVFMSGSILAILAGTFFILLTPWWVRILFVLIAVPLIIYLINSSDVFFLNRIQKIVYGGLDWHILLLDYSINLRVGHVIYTLWSSIPAALMLQTVPDFETAYNTWASGTAYFYLTESNFILTGAGSVIYRGGIFGVFILIALLVRAYRSNAGRGYVKLAILIFLLLAQLGISSTFIMLFAVQNFNVKK